MREVRGGPAGQSRCRALYLAASLLPAPCSLARYTEFDSKEEGELARARAGTATRHEHETGKGPGCRKMEE